MVRNGGRRSLLRFQRLTHAIKRLGCCRFSFCHLRVSDSRESRRRSLGVLSFLYLRRLESVPASQQRVVAGYACRCCAGHGARARKRADLTHLLHPTEAPLLRKNGVPNPIQRQLGMASLTSWRSRQSKINHALMLTHGNSTEWPPTCPTTSEQEFPAFVRRLPPSRRRVGGLRLPFWRIAGQRRWRFLLGHR
jgi:hypothetical protein